MSFQSHSTRDSVLKCFLNSGSVTTLKMKTENSREAVKQGGQWVLKEAISWGEAGQPRRNHVSELCCHLVEEVRMEAPEALFGESSCPARGSVVQRHQHGSELWRCCRNHPREALKTLVTSAKRLASLGNWPHKCLFALFFISLFPISLSLVP